MKVRSYPGRAVLEDPELLLDPDATRGKAMELLYEASWRECRVNWTDDSDNSKSKISIVRQRHDNESYKRSYNEMSDMEDRLPFLSREDTRSRVSSSTDSDCSDVNQQPPSHKAAQGGFLIPRPRLIVPVHTYARRRRTGAPQPIKKRQIGEGSTLD